MFWEVTSYSPCLFHLRLLEIYPPSIFSQNLDTITSVPVTKVIPKFPLSLCWCWVAMIIRWVLSELSRSKFLAMVMYLMVIAVLDLSQFLYKLNRQQNNKYLHRIYSVHWIESGWRQGDHVLLLTGHCETNVQNRTLWNSCFSPVGQRKTNWLFLSTTVG